MNGLDHYGIVIVGASLAGLRTCEALRGHGYRGRITIIGDEPHPPYDRPPLSKGFLTGSVPRTRLGLSHAGLDADWRLGLRATGVDLASRQLHLDDGTRMEFGGLVVATGSSSSPWPGPLPKQGVHVLRTVDDAARLRRELRPGGRLLVVGGGFIGCETAATARELGMQVTLVHTGRYPLYRFIGGEAGAFVAALHRQADVDLRCSTTVEGFTGEAALTAARLSDGKSVEADVAILALGARPNTDWLAGSGLWIDRGLRCDQHCRALLNDGSPATGVVAAGDVACWPHPWVPRPIRLGHWSNAVEQAGVAARSLLRPDEPGHYRPVPSFWSDQYGVKLRSVGFPHLAEQTRVEANDPAAGRLEISYYRAGRLVGALTAGRAARIVGYRSRLADAIRV
ncbi:NAD(P)/FAD-dependent oxidoreductase [Sphaerimonospora cavernae]|uniref:NAD(P)/FAD-dependent oxidoreductase n=1 Tax=Sphaerimonospora cavernae TaxID=1740611 RepID=A0ABV6UB98_9ACTN